MSDEELVIFGLIGMLVGAILILWAVLDVVKKNKGSQSSSNYDEPQRNSSRPQSSSPNGSQGNLPTWKRIEMEAAPKKEQQTDSHNCIFCGEAMSDTQVFCGACGRRRD